MKNKKLNYIFDKYGNEGLEMVQKINYLLFINGGKMKLDYEYILKEIDKIDLNEYEIYKTKYPLENE